MRSSGAILLCLILIVGCKKKSNDITGGGTGGHATLLVTPEHHNLFVDSCTIYIKYGTNDAPANGLYDDSAICHLSDTTPIATFSGLTKGQYYLFGKGYHAPFSPPNVKGGIPCTISSDNSTTTIYLPTYSY